MHKFIKLLIDSAIRPLLFVGAMFVTFILLLNFGLPLLTLLCILALGVDITVIISIMTLIGSTYVIFLLITNPYKSKSSFYAKVGTKITQAKLIVFFVIGLSTELFYRDMDSDELADIHLNDSIIIIVAGIITLIKSYQKYKYHPVILFLKQYPISAHKLKFFKTMSLSNKLIISSVIIIIFIDFFVTRTYLIMPDAMIPIIIVIFTIHVLDIITPSLFAIDIPITSKIITIKQIATELTKDNTYNTEHLFDILIMIIEKLYEAIDKLKLNANTLQEYELNLLKLDISKNIEHIANQDLEYEDDKYPILMDRLAELEVVAENII